MTYTKSTTTTKKSTATLTTPTTTMTSTPRYTTPTTTATTTGYVNDFKLCFQGTSICKFDVPTGGSCKQSKRFTNSRDITSRMFVEQDLSLDECQRKCIATEDCAAVYYLIGVGGQQYCRGLNSTGVAAPSAADDYSYCYVGERVPETTPTTTPTSTLTSTTITTTARPLTTFGYDLVYAGTNEHLCQNMNTCEPEYQFGHARNLSAQIFLEEYKIDCGGSQCPLSDEEVYLEPMRKCAATCNEHEDCLGVYFFETYNDRSVKKCRGLRSLGNKDASNTWAKEFLTFSFNVSNV